MQNADTVLGVLRERGGRGLPLEELYRQLFNPQLYLLAYGRCAARRLVVSPTESGGTRKTVPGFNGFTLRRKAIGDGSMPEKRRSCSGVRNDASRDPQ
jgi:hypothetical protein